MLTSLYDENQSSQKSTLNASLILANANSKTTSIGTISSSSYCYAQELSLILQNVIAFLVYRTVRVRYSGRERRPYGHNLVNLQRIYVIYFVLLTVQCNTLKY